ncbi:MAG TPA: (2Fe-2S) ferredoxin domain-containing protein [Sedimentisphaerales bacterium]|nr:(2Fe-2S) ferredoxin domain-containing protein [Sedimentisphaerales bacterium]
MDTQSGKPVTLEICAGTTCFIMAANSFETIEEQIEACWPNKVDIRICRCLDLCRAGKFNGAPYIRLNSVPVGKADLGLILNLIEEILGPAVR